MSETKVLDQSTPMSSPSAVPEVGGDNTAKCFLCNRMSDRVVWRARSGHEARLCSCGLVYTNPKPPPGSIDYTKDIHPEEFYSYPARLKAKWMARYCPGGRLLEVGCGKGSFLAAARSCGYEVFGLEPDIERAKHAAKILGIEVDQSFLEGNKLPKASFDVVYHCDLLAHFPDPKKALKEMTSLLRPGGVLCFEVGLVSELSPGWYRLIEFMGGLDLGPHLWFYSRRSLEFLLRQTGLCIEHIKTFGLAPEAIAFLAKRLLLDRSSDSHRSGTPTLPEKPQKFRYFKYYFLRYLAGSLVPRFGPQTAFLVARPWQHDVAN